MSDSEEKQGWFSRLKGALRKTSDSLTEGVSSLFTKKPLDEEMLLQLEEVLIAADLGPALAHEICDDFRRTRFGKEVTDQEVREALAEKIAATLAPFEKSAGFSNPKPFVALMVGVNGAGKTTTMAKMAQQLKQQGKKTLLVAGDTFRAAAVEQLKVWASRVGAPVLAGEAGADPASLAFKSVEQAKADGTDVVLIDTAGRLQNKTGLMEELQKVVRVLKKQDETAPHAAFLVLDATTGQNALSQVEVFASMIPLTGLIITKLDGSAKGGALVRAVQQAKLPVVGVGVGEGIEDLQSFRARDFARALCGI